jgi:hypothetical protein
VQEITVPTLFEGNDDPSITEVGDDRHVPLIYEQLIFD